VVAVRADAPEAMQAYGTAIKDLREARGLTQDQLARQLGYSRSQVSGIENALDLGHVDFASACDGAFGTGVMLRSLHERAQRQGLPSWAVERLTYESRAKIIEAFQAGLVHGFLQTAAYTRAVLGGGLPGDVSEEKLNDAVEERLRRQDVLTGGQLDVCHIILDESILHRRVGGSDVMREQLSHVLDVIEKRLALIQILPYEAGACTPPGSVNIMTLDDGSRRWGDRSPPPTAPPPGPRGA
jgi:transcriptional regulator with XRE-family HTH domain